MASLLDKVKGKIASEQAATTSTTMSAVATGASTEGVPALSRTHNDNYKPTIEGIQASIESLMMDLETVSVADAARNQSKPIYKRRGGNTKATRIAWSKRANNKAEKDEMAAFIKDAFAKDENLKSQVLDMLISYGKIFSLEMPENKKLLAKAVTKSAEAGFTPKFYAQKMREFLLDYQGVMLDLMKRAANSGKNLKFFSWGVIAEPLKEDFSEILTATLSSAESLRFLYSKFAFYASDVDSAAVVSRRIILATGMVTSHLVNNDYVKKELLVSENISNETVIDAIKSNPKHKELAWKEDVAPLRAAAFGEELSEHANKLYVAAIIAAGIAPHCPMQSSEYKQATAGTIQPAVIQKTWKAVAYNFGLIRMIHNKLTGRKVAYKSTMFKDCLVEAFKMWRPIFVIARAGRQFMFPQAQYAVNSKIDLAEYLTIADLNDDTIDLAAYM